MTDKTIEVKITDADDNVVATYKIYKQTIISNAKRLSLMQPFIDDEGMDVFTKNAYFSAAALAPVLADKKGELIYTGDDAVQRLLDDMDVEVFRVLCEAYNELNPTPKTLSAKKKKS